MTSLIGLSIVATAFIYILAHSVYQQERDAKGRYSRRYGNGTPRAKHLTFKKVIYYSDLHK